MEDILNTYSLPYDENIPVICMDEKPYQLLGESREAIPMKKGKVKKTDYEYRRNGTCSIFIFTEPLGGWRHTDVCERRRRKDWAKQIHELLTVHYPDKQKIRLVMDNLNTHTIGSLYEVFPPGIAGSLANRLEIHYTPKHGSWLNIAEIELSAMQKQCLGRRIDTIEKLKSESMAWELTRNKNQKAVGWQFKTNDARIKLKRLYPVVIMDNIQT